MRQVGAISSREGRLGRSGTAAYTPRFITDLVTGGGAWRREARVVLGLAARHGLTLDEQTLIFSDVRDLQALAQRLQARRPRPERAGHRAARRSPDGQPPTSADATAAADCRTPAARAPRP